MSIAQYLANTAIGRNILKAADAAGVLSLLGLPPAASIVTLDDLNSTAGLVVQTGADTFTKRTLTAGSGITITNGDGVSGAPTVAVDSSVVTLTGTQVLTNKTLGAGGVTYLDGYIVGTTVGGIDGGILDVRAGTGVDASGGQFGAQGGTANGASGGGVLAQGGSALNANGGYLDMHGGTLPGGDISTYDGGGAINTRGTGSIQLGVAGTRTTVVGQAVSDITLTLPKSGGTLVLRSYVDQLVAGLLDFKGDLDCSANPDYPGADNGDAYFVSVAGKVGGASGQTVEIGDLVVAKADNAGGTEASVGSSWFVLQKNLVGALVSSNNLNDVANAATARTNLGLTDLATTTPGTDVATALGVNVGSAGAVVVNGGALGTPASGSLVNCTGLPVAGGGTGRSSATAYAVLCGGTTSTGAFQSVASVGSSGQVLTSNGAGALPTFQTFATAQAIVLTSNFDMTTSTYTDVPGMAITLQSGGKYVAEFIGRATVSDAGGAQMRFNGTATFTSVSTFGEGFNVSATGDGTVGVDNTTKSIGVLSATSVNATMFLVNSGSGGIDCQVRMTGVFIVDAGGTLTVQFSQSTTDFDSSVLTHGIFRVTKCS